MCDWDDENTDFPDYSSEVQNPKVKKSLSIPESSHVDNHRRLNEYRPNGKQQWKAQQTVGVDSNHVLEMTIHPNECGKVIGRGGCKIKQLQEETNTRIKVCKDRSGYLTVPVTISGNPDDCESAKNLIESLIGAFTSSSNAVDNNYGHDGNMTEDGFIDWSKVNSRCREQSAARWASLPPVKKNFYIEDDEVADMSETEVANWRLCNFNISVIDLSEDNRSVLNPVSTFHQAFMHYPEVLGEIAKQGFEKPSPIQSQMWPLVLRGHDVIGIAQTGTGKTLAFLLPAFIHIDLQPTPRQDRHGPSAVVLTPTRELALQIEQEIKKYCYRGIRCVCVYGGGDRRRQIELVSSGVEIIVATPGRFNDLLGCNVITLESVTFLVLDEADRMLDMGFEPQIMKILLDIRPDRQTLMTSATWPSGVRRLAQNYMKDPFQINVGSLDLAATHTVRQEVEIIAEEEKKQKLLDFLYSMEPEDKVIVFVGRKAVCDDLSSDLCLRDIVCQSIHGGREQYDREQALDDFKTGAVRILVATDVASRGLDVKDITHVFNYDFPRNTEEYVHRVGRTGRAGRTGTSISLVTRNDWGSAKDLIAILEEAMQDVPVELHEMAERFERMKEKRAADRFGGGSGGRRYDNRGQRGGRGRRGPNGGYRSMNSFHF